MTGSKALRHQRAETVAIAAGGAGVFWLLSLPLPFLFGPMLACLIAALARRPLRGLGQVSIAARTIIGVAAGASLTPALVGQIPQMAASLAFIPLYIVIIGAIGLPYFHRFCGFDRVTAWYAAMPGGLQDMVIFGAEAGGNGRSLSLIHATRVLIIVTLVPVIMVASFDLRLDGAIGAPVAEMAWRDLALMIVAAAVGWRGGVALGLFGASVLGPLIVAGALSLMGLLTVRPPAEAMQAAQFLIGLAIGVGYVGVTWAEIRHDILAGVGFVVILGALAAVFAQAIVTLGLAPPIEAFLSYAPGGQAEMMILAIVAGADLGVVALHHLLRIFLVITGAPIVSRWVLPKTVHPGPPEPPGTGGQGTGGQDQDGNGGGKGKTR